MKTHSRQHGRKSLLLATLASGLFLLGGTRPASAGEILSTDFSKGTFEELGWTAKGDWAIMDYSAKKPDLANNPGPVAVFSAKSKTAGMLTKKFDPVTGSLTLTFDGGYGWGKKDHAQKLEVMLLDADGNGYIFDARRANAKWAVNWGIVTKYGFNEPLTMSDTVIDASQDAIVNGGGLRTFTITRDAAGKWTFNGDGWTGGPLTFTDTTISNFSQLILVGTTNSDELIFNKIKFEATK